MGVVDYTLAKRALIRDFRTGLLSRLEICDAHPELLRAARYLGVEASRPCPVCKRFELRLLAYVYADGLNGNNGRAAPSANGKNGHAGRSAGDRNGSVRPSANGPNGRENRMLASSLEGQLDEGISPGLDRRLTDPSVASIL